jgi:hypothetical protein
MASKVVQRISCSNLVAMATKRNYKNKLKKLLVKTHNA